MTLKITFDARIGQKAAQLQQLAVQELSKTIEGGDGKVKDDACITCLGSGFTGLFPPVEA